MTYDLTETIQEHADAEHQRSPVCSWCRHPGEPYEHHGVRFDGLTACEGDRLCASCRERYTQDTPLLVEDRWRADQPGALYDLNRHTAAWSEQHIPGCRGEPGVTPIALQYRAEYADLALSRHRRRP